MAGGKVKRSLKDFLIKKEIDNYYSDDHLYGRGYKPLKKVRISRDTEKYPLLHYVISAAEGSPSIEDITIVGEKNRIENFLEKQGYYKDITVVQQKGSILENAILAYENCNTNKHALFLASDIPKLTSFSIEDFLKRCYGNHDVYFPIVGWENTLTGNNRPPLKLIDNRKTNLQDKLLDSNGRRGFRIGNLIYANPNKIMNKYLVDIGYNIRKLMLPQNMITAWKHLGPEFRKKYFNKKLSIKDIEHKASEILGTNFKLIELYSSDIEEDIDSEKDIENLESGF